MKKSRVGCIKPFVTLVSCWREDPLKFYQANPCTSPDVKLAPDDFYSLMLFLCSQQTTPISTKVTFSDNLTAYNNSLTFGAYRVQQATHLILINPLCSNILFHHFIIYLSEVWLVAARATQTTESVGMNFSLVWSGCPLR